MTLEENRLHKIRIIERALIKSIDKGMSVDYENMVRETNLLFGSSRRTSMDYLDLAMRNTNCIVVSVDGSKEIINRKLSYDQIRDKNTNVMRNLSEEEKSIVRGA